VSKGKKQLCQSNKLLLTAQFWSNQHERDLALDDLGGYGRRVKRIRRYEQKLNPHRLHLMYRSLSLPNILDATVDSDVPTLPHVIPYGVEIEPWKYLRDLQRNGGRGRRPSYQGEGSIEMHLFT